MCLRGIQGIGQEHVRVERVVLGLDNVLAVTVVHGNSHLGLFWQKTAQVGTGGELILIVILVAALGYRLLNAAEASRHHLAGGREGTYVGQLYVQVALCGPTAFVGEFLQAQFVDPHLHTAVGIGMVADTYHYGLHLAQ